MDVRLSATRACAAACGLLLAGLAIEAASTQTQPAPVQFGGAYSSLDARRQQFVNDWVARFTAATGQKLEAGPFYDDFISLSAKTTFDAVTHALMTTTLTDASGAALGDALALVERVESVRGQVPGASGDRQFRIYVRLTAAARDTLARAREFKRESDNSIYHKGYPVNYREQGGIPSIQISSAQDFRRADIDVDYRSSSFPVALFNGHLSASNSDVRAGDNSERHVARWAGLRSWWRAFFGGGADSPPDNLPQQRTLIIPKIPRVGKQAIEVMAYDFLNAWLVEGDVLAAMGYVSERSYACMAQNAKDPSDFDRGIAPFQLMQNMKAAHDALEPHSSLDGVAMGVRLTMPGLKVVSQPHHAQVVIYGVRDDVAAAFDCESQLTLGDSRKAGRAYGHYFGSTLYISGRKDHRLALLWAKDDGYWKIVSWQTGIEGREERDTPTPEVPRAVKVARTKADPGLVQAARAFVETWLIKKDYDAAFAYLSSKSYACYDLSRSQDQPASTSPADAGRRIREALDRVGKLSGAPKSLDALLAAPDSFHLAIRVMDHPLARTFSLTSLPDALGDALECAARARASTYPDPLPLLYGNAFGMAFRFRTMAGDAPVLRLLWRKEDAAWRITGYDIEVP